MCGWSILSLESYQGKLLKNAEWYLFLRAKALQGCQMQIKVIVKKNISLLTSKFGIITFSMPHCILIL